MRAEVEHLQMSSSRAMREEPWSAPLQEVFVGKDVLELLSSSMYVDPLTIYREYVQNAVDAIDEAKRIGLIGPSQSGKISVHPDASARAIRVRDNGTGLSWSDFQGRLMALGGSVKRGSSARGFRGVGRLAGLGYCQELIFRSRSEGETLVSELRWDCRELKRALRANGDSTGLSDLVKRIVSTRRIKGDGFPSRFFEVEMHGVIRHKDDRLLNPSAIADYLAQVAPVPFDPDFQFGAEISAALRQHVTLGEVALQIDGCEGLVYRPHRNLFVAGDKKNDNFADLSIHTIQGLDGNTAAIAWVLHHSYLGAIPQSALIKGLRLRSGNIQVGDHTLLEELFPETRFNAWAVGEVHIVDSRITPNGRRDHFEQSAHFNNVLVQMLPVARDIAKRCRANSAQRKWQRDLELHAQSATEKLKIIAQGAISPAARSKLAAAIERSLRLIERTLEKRTLSDDTRAKYQRFIATTRKKLEGRRGGKEAASPLKRFPREKRTIYQSVFDLIYQCSTNRAAAKALVDKIMLQL